MSQRHTLHEEQLFVDTVHQPCKVGAQIMLPFHIGLPLAKGACLQPVLQLGESIVSA